jgi:hypothetical protein
MVDMTPRERIIAAYRHEPVDRVPCSPRIWAWLLSAEGTDDVAAHLRLQKRYPIDIQLTRNPFRHVTALDRVVGPVAPGVRADVKEWQEGRLMMVRRTFHTLDGTLTDVTGYPPTGESDFGVRPDPVRVEFLIKGRRDLDAFRSLMVPPKAVADFEPCRRMEAEIGDRGLFLVEIPSPLCHRGGWACSMQDLMVWYHTDRELFDGVFKLFREQMLEEARLTLEAGFRTIFASYYYESLSAGWSPGIWREVFQPTLRELCELVHADGGMVNFYDDGKCRGILELLAEAGVDVLQTLTPPPVGDIDLGDAKRRIGDRVCLMGCVDLLYVIKLGSPELIDRTVREAMETAAPGGGFILGTSDSIREGTPEENIRAYFTAALNYGRKPGSTG